MAGKESVRARYKKKTDLEPLTKAGKKTSAYESYLLSKDDCTVPWMSNWNALEKKAPFKDKPSLMKELESLDKANRLEEKCIVGGAGRGERLKAVAKFRRDMKAKFDIANY